MTAKRERFEVREGVTIPAVAVAQASSEFVDAAGRGRLVVEQSDRGSVVTHAFAASPLRWLTPRSGVRSAWIFASSYGGGLVNGDALDVDITVDRDACAMLSTQASTKVYPSPDGTRTRLEAHVAQGACLVNLPDPVVCYTGARYHQQQTFTLEAGASLVTLDWMTSGRLAYGERWAFDEYRAKTVVRGPAGMRVYDVVRLNQEDGRLDRRLGRFDVLALLVVAGQRLAAEIDVASRKVAAMAPRLRPGIIASAAPIAGGAVIRIAGMRVEEVRSTVRGLLEFVPALLGDDPWARKW